MKTSSTLISTIIFLIQSCSDRTKDKVNLSFDNNSSLSVETLNIALKPNKDVQGQRNDEKILGDALSEIIGIPVNITTPSNKTIIEAGLANKTIDIGYVSSSDAISFTDNEVGEVLLAGLHKSTDPDGKEYEGPFYYSVWLCYANALFNL